MDDIIVNLKQKRLNAEFDPKLVESSVREMEMRETAANMDNEALLNSYAECREKLYTIRTKHGFGTMSVGKLEKRSQVYSTEIVKRMTAPVAESAMEKAFNSTAKGISEAGRLDSIHYLLYLWAKNYPGEQEHLAQLEEVASAKIAREGWGK